MIRILMFCICALPGMLAAQQRAGVTGAQVLQFLPGSRASGLMGAYTAVGGDADAVFYNPAGIAPLRQGVAFSYERYVSGIGFGSAGAVTRLGSISVGASVAFFDAGTIREIVPDPQFGGNTGMETGATVSSSETALRLVGAWPLNDRLRIGAAAGFISSSLAEQQQSAAFADAGVQYDVGRATLGVSLRNLGPQLSGDGAEDYLPSELRFGGSIQFFAVETVMFNTTADLIFRIGESTAMLVGGLEMGLPLTSERPYQLLGRAGFDAEQNRVGAFRVGATIGIQHIAFDYSLQQFEHFGSVHRIGLRLNRLR